MDVDELFRRFKEQHVKRVDTPRAGGVILDRPTASAFDRLSKRVSDLEQRIVVLEFNTPPVTPGDSDAK